MSENSLRKVKIIIFGETNVGKTTLLTKYLTNESKNVQPTTGTDISKISSIIDSQQVTFEYWDTAGQERFRSMTQKFFANADGGICVFDITNLSSFENIKKWYDDFKASSNENSSFILVGNKSDLNESRTVNKEKGEELAQLLECQYIEASALNGDNVKEIFSSFEELTFRSLKNFVIPGIIDINTNSSVNDKKDDGSNCKC